MTTISPQDHDDALITAYALGELDGSQRDQVERLLAAGTPAAAAAQREIARIREFGALLARDLRAEVEAAQLPMLSDAQRAVIARAARPRAIIGWRTLAALASTGLAAGLLVVLGLPGGAPPATTAAAPVVATRAAPDQRREVGKQLSERQKDAGVAAQEQSASGRPSVNGVLGALEKKATRSTEPEQATDQLADRKRALKDADGVLGGKPGATASAAAGPQDEAERAVVLLDHAASDLPPSVSVAAPAGAAAGTPLARADGRANGAYGAAAAPMMRAAASARPVAAPVDAAPALAAAAPAPAAPAAPLLAAKAAATPAGTGEPAGHADQAGADKEAAVANLPATAAQGGELQAPAVAGGRARGGRTAPHAGDLVPAASRPLSAIPIPRGDAGGAPDTLRRCLDAGMLPPAELIGLPQLVSTWSGPLAGPAGDAPAAIAISLGECPWDASHQLARIALRARSAPPPAPGASAAHIVLVIDTSASMAGDERLPLIQGGIERLLAQLGEGDRVEVVVAGDAVRELEPGSGGDRRARLRTAVHALSAGGTARLADAISLATRLAHDPMAHRVASQVVVCTAGQGVPATAVPLAAGVAQDGNSLSVVAVGHDHPGEGVLEALAARGHGRFTYITTAAASAQLFTALRAPPIPVVVRDAVLQLAIDPARVAAYSVLDVSQTTVSEVSASPSAALRAAGPAPDVLLADQQMVALVELALVDRGAVAERDANKADGREGQASQGGTLISVTLRGRDLAGQAYPPLVARLAASSPLASGDEAQGISAAVADFALALGHPRASQGAWPRILAEARAASRLGLADGEELVDLARRAAQLVGGAPTP